MSDSRDPMIIFSDSSDPIWVPKTLLKNLHKLNASINKPNKARVPSMNPKQCEKSPLNGEVVYNLRKMLVSTQRRELL